MLIHISTLFYLIASLKDTVSLTEIGTIPPTPSNVVATGYSGLIVTSKLNITNTTSSCSWMYRSELLNFYSIASGCINSSDGNITITCEVSNIDGSNHVTSNMTLLQPLSTNLNVSVSCGSTIVSLPYITVADCPNMLPYNVVVLSNANTFGEPGLFNCSKNGNLFYSNATSLLSSETTCSFSATWIGQNNLQCWLAPVASLIGNRPVTEDEVLNLTCSYSDVIPVGNMTAFYIGGPNPIEMEKGKPLIKHMAPRDDNSVIYCQAVTPYTRIYGDSGRSQVEIADVSYRPYQDTLTTCDWTMNEEGSCDVEFYANPLPQFVLLTKNGVDVNNDIRNAIWGDVYGNMLFRFRKNKVAETDAGFYILEISSPAFTNSQTINFTVVVSPMHLTTSSSTIISSSLTAEASSKSNTITILIVVCSLLGALLVAMVIVFVILKCNFIKNAKTLPNNNPSNGIASAAYNDFPPATSQDSLERTFRRYTYIEPTPNMPRAAEPEYEVPMSKEHKLAPIADSRNYIDLNMETPNAEEYDKNGDISSSNEQKNTNHQNVHQEYLGENNYQTLF